MNIYIAASYGRIDEALVSAMALREDGHYVTSFWLTRIPEQEQWSRMRCAAQDVHDIMMADCVLCFTGTSNTSGGHHVEVGLGIAQGNLIVLVGPRQNVFHHLPDVEQYNTFDEARQILRYAVPPDQRHPNTRELSPAAGMEDPRQVQRFLDVMIGALRPTTPHEHGQ